jgi:hypothetical protein
VLLGEQRLDTWIGLIEVKRRESVSAVPLARLQAQVSKTIETVQARLPQKPLAEIPDGELRWTMWKLEPRTRADCPEQTDLFVRRSMLPGMWQAAHFGAAFFSERFSRQRETFCYVKLDGKEGIEGEVFANKTEDALDTALRAAGFGAVVGGGTGLRYSYVDLPLADIDGGIAVVREVLSAGKVPKRSWILFFDAVFAGEWVGLYVDTPPPPR